MKKVILNALWAKIKNTFVATNSDATLKTLTITGTGTGISISATSGNTINMVSGKITIGNVDNPTTGQNGISISNNNITFKDKPGSSLYSATYNTYGISYSGTAATINLNNGYINGVGGIYGNSWSVSGVSQFNLNSSGGLYFNWGAGPGTISGVTTISMASGSSSNVNLNGGYITGGTGITLNSSGTLKFGSRSGLGSITGVNSLNVSSGGQIILGSTNDVVLQKNYLSFQSGVGSATIDGVQNLNLVGTGQLSFSGGASGNGSISGVKTINMASGGAVSISFGPTISGQGLNMNYKDISNLYHMGLIGDIKINNSQLKIDGTNISFYSGTGNGVISGVRDIYFSSQATLTGYISGSTGSKKTIMSNIVIDSSNTLEVPMIINVTYSELNTLKNGSKLIPGQSYRITDYVTTINDIIITNARSAGHQFDILVRADSTNTLNEQAWAMHHDGDTYFNDARLEAWQLKYQLDNVQWSKQAGTYITEEEDGYIFKLIGDITLAGNTYKLLKGFDMYIDDWSEYALMKVVAEGEQIISYDGDPDNFDPENLDVVGTASSIDIVSEGGKGTITWMKDEHDNECPYDFKNVQFKRYMTTDSVSGRNGLGGKYMIASRNTPQGLSIQNMENFIWAYTFSSDSSGGEQMDYSLTATYSVYGNVLRPYSRGLPNNVMFGHHSHSNIFGLGCYENSLDRCYNNFYGNSYANNSLGYNCSNNSWGNSCSSNSLGSSCHDNSWGNACVRNSLGSSCSNNSWGNYCISNSWSNEIVQSTLFEMVCYTKITTQNVKNVQVLNNVSGSNENNKLTLTFAANKSYTQVAAKTSAGALKIYVPGDLA